MELIVVVDAQSCLRRSASGAPWRQIRARGKKWRRCCMLRRSRRPRVPRAPSDRAIGSDASCRAALTRFAASQDGSRD
jgi:hypothetical protein